MPRHVEAEIDPPCSSRLYRDEPPPLPDKPPATGLCGICGHTRPILKAEIHGRLDTVCVPCHNAYRQRERNLAQADEADDIFSDAEWEALGATDLISADELVRITRPEGQKEPQ